MPELTTRVEATYKNLSQRYLCTSDFTKQYCAIYNVRIERMRSILKDRIEALWGQDIPISRLHELSTGDADKYIVIGTLFKDQKLKPSVLKQLAEANQLVPQPVYTHFTDESDILYIEDELQRYQLIGNINGNLLVTGITCALLGVDGGKGKFEVEDYCFADYRLQVDRPISQQETYVVFISGLDLMHVEKSLQHLQLFTNWIAGSFHDFDLEARKVARLIIAGNSIRTETTKAKPTIAMTSRSVESAEVIDSVKTLDSFLLQMCQILDVDVMSGECDPSNHVLPQKGMHHCMFPYSSVYKSTNFVSNPYYCEVGGCRLLGNSGQPVTDILRFSNIKEPVDALESCLKWNHMAPTAPDTLGCFPFYDNDPFIIEECPHVFFTGNQDKFDTKMVTGADNQRVRLICVPDFSTTGTVCLLNLKDLNCMPISFKL